MKARLLLNVTICFYCLCTCSSLYGLDSTSQAGDPAIGQAGSSSAHRQTDATYLIQKGDCLGKILRSSFSLPDEVIFSPRTHALMTEANPHLQNLSDLREGEQLIVPVILLQHQPQGTAYSVEKPASEEQQLNTVIRPDISPHPAKAVPVTGANKMHALEPPADTAAKQAPEQAYAPDSDEIPIQEKTISSRDTMEREKRIRRLLSSFAAAFRKMQVAKKLWKSKMPAPLLWIALNSPCMSFPGVKKLSWTMAEGCPRNFKKL
jgi:hypothetical protein